MFDLPAPPPLQLNAIGYATLAVALLVGAALLVWGRILGRILLGLSAAGIGVWVGGFIPIGIPQWIIQLVTAVIFGVLGLIIARLLWALAAAALFAAIGGTVAWALTWNTIDPAVRPACAPAETTLSYFQNLLTYAANATVYLWGHNTLYLVLGFLPAGVLAGFIAIVRPRLAKIFMTALLGAASVVAVVVTFIVQIYPPAWDAIVAWFYLPVAAGVVLTAGGMSYQYVRTAACDNQKGRDEAEPPAPKPDQAAKK